MPPSDCSLVIEIKNGKLPNIFFVNILNLKSYKCLALLADHYRQMAAEEGPGVRKREAGWSTERYGRGSN